MHEDIKTSGLAEFYGISTVVDSSDDRHKYLGKVVRFKDTASIKVHGNIIAQYDFLIKEVQNNYRQEKILRGYAVDRRTGKLVEGYAYEMGKPIFPEDVFIVQ